MRVRRSGFPPTGPSFLPSPPPEAANPSIFNTLSAIIGASARAGATFGATSCKFRFSASTGRVALPTTRRHLPEQPREGRRNQIPHNIFPRRARTSPATGGGYMQADELGPSVEAHHSASLNGFKFPEPRGNARENMELFAIWTSQLRAIARKTCEAFRIKFKPSIDAAPSYMTHEVKHGHQALSLI